MKAIALVALFALSGCIIEPVPTSVTKTVTIERDADGKILKRVEVVTATQHFGDQKIILEWIKLQEAPPRPESHPSGRR